MSNKYYVTYNDVLKNSHYPGGLINIWINKNPGRTSTDPNYPALTEIRCIRSFWNLITNMPAAEIKVKE